MKDLPLGLYTFENLINDNFVYIDKTEYIYKLIQPQRAAYFLSRPRRFGKSLLVSTLKAIFEGNRDLFTGLWLAEQSDYAFEPYPVLSMNLSLERVTDAAHLRQALWQQIDQLAEDFGITLENQTYSSRFAELIRDLGREKPVVLLIDEYDKPMLDHLTKPTRDEIKEILKGFYIVIKASDPYLRFVLLTGVTKFSKVSIFSELNHLNDLTMDSRYASMLGITQPELERYFPARLQALADTQALSYEETLAKIRVWYNGYRFSDEETHVYNPFSTLHLLDKRKFDFHWFETGTPTFLLDLIKQTPASWAQIPDEKWAAVEEFGAYEVENLRPLPLLFQTGYLTIHEVNSEFMTRLYRLDYPNFEVESGFLSHLVKNFSALSEEASHLFRLTRYFQAGDIDSALEEMRVFFANIEYDLHLKYEKYYQTIFFAVFKLLGFNIRTEVKTNRGRIDALVETSDTFYLFEFKLNGTAQEALQQIKTETYFQKFLSNDKEILMVGVAFDQTERNIGEWVVEPYIF